MHITFCPTLQMCFGILCCYTRIFHDALTCKFSRLDYKERTTQSWIRVHSTTIWHAQWLLLSSYLPQSTGKREFYLYAMYVLFTILCKLSVT